MKITDVRTNIRKKDFEISTTRGEFSFPFAKLDVKPTPSDRVAEVFPDPEVAMEGFTYRLESGKEDTLLIDQVLEYNRDPSYYLEIVLHRLSLEAQKAVKDSSLSKRELIRRLGTSASQFYRLLDQTNYSKSVGQMISLLHIAGCDVDIQVTRPKPRKRRRAAGASQNV